MLDKFLKRKQIVTPPPAVPPGIRVYAIGDIHGRFDLMDDLLARIDLDDHSRCSATTKLVFLGDLIDRGPDTAKVVERGRLLSHDRPESLFLMGNHEELFLKAIEGNDKALRTFCRVGGRETILSYGVNAEDFERMSYADVSMTLNNIVPGNHIEFLNNFGTIEVIGGYAFVHAGINPNTSLEEQHAQDLRWIREPFLSFQGMLPKVIVHGHTIRPSVEFLSHRIGIDTGAYETGRLTALGLEGADRWILQTS